MVRSSRTTAAEILGREPRGILVGPGPGEPAGAGSSEDLIRAVLDLGPGAPPLLGVCLGHQALHTALGGRLRRATTLVHGATRPVEHDGEGVFAGLPNPVPIARYNSLVVDEASLHPDLVVTARTEDGDVAGLRHRTAPLEGVQGHPESILCVQDGARLFGNWLARVGISRPTSA